MPVKMIFVIFRITVIYLGYHEIGSHEMKSVAFRDIIQPSKIRSKYSYPFRNVNSIIRFLDFCQSSVRQYRVSQKVLLTKPENKTTIYQDLLSS